jgi:hypothetical protein
VHIISIYVSLGVMNKMKVISYGGSSHGLNVESSIEFISGFSKEII